MAEVIKPTFAPIAAPETPAIEPARVVARLALLEDASGNDAEISAIAGVADVTVASVRAELKSSHLICDYQFPRAVTSSRCRESDKSGARGDGACPLTFMERLATQGGEGCPRASFPAEATFYLAGLGCRSGSEQDRATAPAARPARGQARRPGRSGLPDSVDGRPGRTPRARSQALKLVCQRVTFGGNGQSCGGDPAAVCVGYVCRAWLAVTHRRGFASSRTGLHAPSCAASRRQATSVSASASAWSSRPSGYVVKWNHLRWTAPDDRNHRR